MTKRSGIKEIYNFGEHTEPQGLKYKGGKTEIIVLNKKTGKKENYIFNSYFHGNSKLKYFPKKNEMELTAGSITISIKLPGIVSVKATGKKDI